MRIEYLFALALAACGAPDDRLSDDQATVEQNWLIGIANEIEQTRAPAAAAPASPGGATYKAVGTEPGWALTIGGGSMHYVGDYGSVKITEPTPAGFRPAPGSYAGKRITLTISPGPCSDGMSDLNYRQKVRLIADGKTVQGCGGGTIAPDGLAGTNWAVTSINGRATPRGAAYFIHFADRDLSARLGCNSISGTWRLNGDHLSTSSLMQTEMACGEPAMSFERLGSAVLSSNMRTEQIDGTRMRLVSEAGSIDLRRAI